MVYDFWSWLHDWRGHLPKKLVRHSSWHGVDLDWLENSSEERQPMNIGTIGVAIAGAIFAVYVFIGIKHGWIK